MLHDPSFEKLVDSVRPQIKETDVATVAQRLINGEKLLLIDVREDHEWQASRIPNSIHLGRGIIERDIATIISDKNQEIILYCGGGFRSALSAYNLKQMGYQNVISMDGGIRGWKEANLPLDTKVVV